MPDPANNPPVFAATPAAINTSSPDGRVTRFAHRSQGLLPSVPFSFGALVILALSVVSTLIVILRPSGRTAATELWTSARQHYYMYQPVVTAWNAAAKTEAGRIDMTLLSMPALEQRMLSGFLSGTPTAELLEVERRIAARAFAGPLHSVGFVDLTDRLKADGLLESINTPSFSPWSSRGRIFGIPHDVHPVMLGYRSDIIEAAGIDLSKVTTWNDLFTALAPLMADTDANGEPDHYILNFWPTHVDLIEVMLLQAGGGYFDDDGRCIVDSAVNRRVVASLAAWCSGAPFPKGSRIAGDAQDFTAAGNNRKIKGDVLCFLMPDWMCGIYRHEMPQLAGKIKLMPLPAWSADGTDGLSTRRTSVYGGTMLGISKEAVKSPEDFERFWAMAKKLYVSDELATTLWIEGEIVAPNKKVWPNPMFDKPDAFFGGQAKGRMYINLAGDVPMRSSSPYFSIAQGRVQDALFAVQAAAAGMTNPGPDQLAAITAVHMAEAQRAVERVLNRNRFLSEGPGGAPPSTPPAETNQ